RADKRNFGSSDQANAGVVAGIHLAGSNARKSAVVLLDFIDARITFLSLYEKIGSSGSLFSDERILSILSAEQSLVDVIVDCPVSEPPCVACLLPSCPGVIRCEDVSVAMMMAVDQRRGRKGAHKLRPINPQNQRLWDVVFARGGPWGNLEPTYSANLAPLVVRARTLQRRLRSIFPELTLRETNVPILISQLAGEFDADDWGRLYRNFERGLETRAKILARLVSTTADILRLEVSTTSLQEIASSVENFHAFMAAAIGAWRLRGVGMEPPQFFKDSPGWVELLDSPEGALVLTSSTGNAEKSGRN
ncbi:MAG: hypothetical protein NTV34_04995, partial [Proteobacteria bacterium]|nr:hypothetical protein [Pseudomonadota bacterium]